MSGQEQLQGIAVRATSSQIRLDSVYQRLNLVRTFCSLAETDLRWGRISGIQRLLKKIHHSVGELQRHLSEPGYVPVDRITLLRDQLDQVVHRAGRIARAGS